MIKLKSLTSDGSSYQVYDGDRLIGHIVRQKGSSGERYLATIDTDGKCSEKKFYASHEALQWIEKQT